MNNENYIVYTIVPRVNYFTFRSEFFWFCNNTNQYTSDGSRYICNLTTDGASSQVKAQKLIKEANPSCRVIFRGISEGTLEKITRRSSEDVQIEIALKEEKSEQILSTWNKNALALIAEGVSPFHPERKMFGSDYEREEQIISYVSSVTNEEISFSVNFKVYQTNISKLDKDTINYYGNLTTFKSEAHEAMQKVCKPLSVFKPKNQNKLLGTEGEKLEAKFYLTKANTVENHFGGYTNCFTFLTKQGQKVRLNSSAKITEDFFGQEGSWINLAVTVKAHNKFKTETNTWLTTIVKSPKAVA